MAAHAGKAPVVLGKHKLYMLPTWHGVRFALLLFALLLASMNYSNGLAYGLTFLLASMAFLSMIVTHLNLSRLQVSARPGLPVFAGERARFTICLNNQRDKDRLGVLIERKGELIARLDVPRRSQHCTTLNVVSTQRGWLEIPRFRLATTFPFALFYAWSRDVRLATANLIYPTPANSYPLPLDSVASGLDDGRRREGEDFGGLREYREGDSPGQVSWKTAARGQGLYSKLFTGGSGTIVWLDWSTLPGADTEQKLSWLTRGVLDAEQRGLRYGLRLPGVECKPAWGEQHQHHCLRQLALYGME